MTQKERQERSRREILRAAMEEFSQKEYENVTMEQICSVHGISKGMMYHYYSGKDELFLLCVEKTFEALKEYIEQETEKLSGQNTLNDVRDYLLIREYFFERYPQYKLIFETAVIHPPKHLAEQIRALHQPIMNMNRRFLESVIARMPLRSDLSPEKAARYLQSVELVLDSVIQRYQNGAETQNLHSLLESAEEILNMLFFGILRQTEPSEQTGQKVQFE